MRVKELLAALSAMDPEAVILLFGDQGDYGTVGQIDTGFTDKDKFVCDFEDEQDENHILPAVVLR